MRSAVVVLVLFTSAGFVALGAQGADPHRGGDGTGTCFLPVEADSEVCFDFKKVWYMTQMGSGFAVVYVRDVNAPAAPQVWNRGQYQLTLPEFEKLLSALKAQGLPLSCPHSAYRRPPNQSLSRAEFCKPR